MNDADDGANAPIPARVDTTLDERGRLCPLPIVHLAGWLRTATAGGVVCVLADDPGFMADLVRWLRVRPARLLASRQEDGLSKVWIERLPP